MIKSVVDSKPKPERTYPCLVQAPSSGVFLALDAHKAMHISTSIIGQIYIGYNADWKLFEGTITLSNE